MPSAVGDHPHLRTVVGAYEEAFALHGDSPAALLTPKGRQFKRFEALTRSLPQPPGRPSVVDYGCGLGHSVPFLGELFPGGFDYTGIDIVPAFIDRCRRRFADHNFFLASELNEVPSADWVISSGTFNTLYTPQPSDHWKLVQEILVDLFRASRLALSVDFMTGYIDFRQPGSYHQDVGALIEFAVTTLSRRLVLDQSYLPFEFSVSIFSDDSRGSDPAEYERPWPR